MFTSYRLQAASRKPQVTSCKLQATRATKSLLGTCSLKLDACAATRARRLGFTLVEIMVVVVILGILAVLVVPRVVGRTDEARGTAARQDVAAIMQALRLYRLDNGRYPTTEQGLPALVAKPQGQPVPSNWKQYLDKVPKDPWGNTYQYLNPGVRGEIDVFTLGADGQPGGSGPDADIGSWDL
jgi:general secretion pathway protein G